MTFTDGWDYETMRWIEFSAAHRGIPMLMLVAVAAQEGGLRWPYHDNDAEGSYGPFQIYVPVHGHDRDYWVGESGKDAVLRAAEAMGARWERTWAQYRGDWLVAPVGTLFAWAPEAQGSRPWRWPEAVDAIALAWRYLGEYEREKGRREGERNARDERARTLRVIASGVTDTRAVVLEHIDQAGAVLHALEDINMRLALQHEAIMNEAG